MSDESIEYMESLQEVNVIAILNGNFSQNCADHIRFLAKKQSQSQNQMIVS